MTVDTARALVLAHGWNPMCYQILAPGMTHWFSPADDAVVGYVPFRRVRVVAGAPVCAAHRLAEVAAEFEADASRAGERVIYVGAGSRLEAAYAARRDHVRVPLGALPAWHPPAWAAKVRASSSLRAQLHRARNKGVVVREWPVREAAVSPALRGILAEWLSDRGLPPLGFMTDPGVLGYPGDRRVFVAERDEHAVAFLVAAPVPARRGWLAEQWPRHRSAPNGTTHLLVDQAMRAFAGEGADFATLGLAPLSARGGAPAVETPLWLRGLLAWLGAHGKRFYNFRGLEAFKASLRPDDWEPVMALATGRRMTPGLLRAVAGAFAGGAPEPFLLRALGVAARDEVARMLCADALRGGARGARHVAAR